MDSSRKSIGCVIMSSGLGKRFGGNKLMADFHGRPLICRALEATDGVFARRVVVTRSTAVADLCRKQGVDVVLHALPHRSDTVRLGLDFLGDVDSCLFCPGDQPLLRQETVAALVRAAHDEPNMICRPAANGVPGSPILFPGWAFEDLKALPAGAGGAFVAKKYPERVRLIPVRDEWELMDVDTPDDLSRMLERELPQMPSRSL